jgi:hypothetical protein
MSNINLIHCPFFVSIKDKIIILFKQNIINRKEVRLNFKK